MGWWLPAAETVGEKARKVDRPSTRMSASEIILLRRDIFEIENWSWFCSDKVSFVFLLLGGYR